MWSILDNITGSTDKIKLAATGVTQETAGNYYHSDIDGGFPNYGVTIKKIADAVIDASKVNLNTVWLLGVYWQSNMPVAGSVAWNTHNLYCNGIKYAINSGNSGTANKYIYWKVGDNFYSVSSDYNAVKKNFIICVNTDGSYYEVWNNPAAPEWIDTPMIANSSVETAKIADAAITNAKIANAAVVSAAIADLAVISGKIADAAIITAKVADLAVATAKIADAAITTAKIADAAIGTAKISDLNVTTLKVANQAITIPVSAYTATGVSLPSGGAWVTIQTISITSTGAPIFLTNSLCTDNTKVQYDISIRLLRGTTEIYNPGIVTGTCLYAFNIVDTPGSGDFTYDLQANSSTAGIDNLADNVSMMALEVKK